MGLQTEFQTEHISSSGRLETRFLNPGIVDHDTYKKKESPVPV